MPNTLSQSSLPAAEWIEYQALLSMHRAAPDDARQVLGLRWEELGTAVVSLAPNGGDILLNRTLGLGLARAATRKQIQAIHELYQGVGTPRYFIHLHPDAQPRELEQWLHETHQPARGWMKFQRGMAPPPALDTGLQVRPAHGDDAITFARIAAEGFGLGRPMIPWIAALADMPGWHLYLSWEGDEPLGTGAMFVQDGIGYLDWGATREAKRGRGSQRALLAHRIREAGRLECRQLVSMTGEAAPGDPQHSYRNLLWAGFKEHYLRRNFEARRATG